MYICNQKKIRINYIEYILTFSYKALCFTLSCCGRFSERQKSRALFFDGSDWTMWDQGLNSRSQTSAPGSPDLYSTRIVKVYNSLFTYFNWNYCTIFFPHRSLEFEEILHLDGKPSKTRRWSMCYKQTHLERNMNKATTECL